MNQPVTRGVVHQEGCRTPWRWITTPLDSNHTAHECRTCNAMWTTWADIRSEEPGDVPEFPRREPHQ